MKRSKAAFSHSDPLRIPLSSGAINFIMTELPVISYLGNTCKKAEA